VLANGEREVFIADKGLGEVLLFAFIVGFDQILRDKNAGLLEQGNEFADAVILGYRTFEGGYLKAVVFLLHAIFVVFDVGILAVFLVADGLGAIKFMKVEEDVAAFGEGNAVADHVDDVIVLVCSKADNHEHGIVRRFLLFSRRIADDIDV